MNDYVNCDSVKLIKGLFPDSVSSLPNDIKFAFVHLDIDLYEGTAAGCVYFYERMTTGGIILVDDYGFLSCPGVREAIDVFFDDKPEIPIYLPSGQALIIKL